MRLSQPYASTTRRTGALSLVPRPSTHCLKGLSADRQQLDEFLALYDEKHAIDQKVRGRAELYVGAKDWPLPIPIVEGHGQWTFDTNAGAQSITDRRIGRNELAALRTLLACVDAQHEYFQLSELMLNRIA
jgi:hypothetical protein